MLKQFQRLSSIEQTQTLDWGGCSKLRASGHPAKLHLGIIGRGGRVG
jgi:hypothetical protein